MKRPSFQFYPADWRKDMALQSCSVAARGLWMDMMCIAHECEPYGHLTVNGKAMTPAQIGRHCGLTEKEAAKLVAELEDAGVPSRTADGVIYSRRMVADECLRNRRAEGGQQGAQHGHKGKEFGKLGGNPKKKGDYNEPGKLYAVQRISGGPIKVGITKYLSQRMNGLRKSVGEDLRLLLALDVADMGGTEAAVHAEFKGRIEGEWISAEWGEVEAVMRGATHPPLQPPPSSSSSSSPSGLGETEDHHHPAGGGAQAGTYDLSEVVGASKPTQAGAICAALRRAGIGDTNPGHPRLLTLIAAGATEAEFTGFAASAIDGGKGFAWVLGAVEGERKRAASTAQQLHRGPMPNKREALEASNHEIAQRWAQGGGQ